MLERLLPERYRDCEYFICGPRAVSELAQRALHARGVRLARVHFELFDMV
jgi:ferredoxin-NADP reductase